MSLDSNAKNVKTVPHGLRCFAFGVKEARPYRLTLTVLWPTCQVAMTTAARLRRLHTVGPSDADWTATREAMRKHGVSDGGIVLTRGPSLPHVSLPLPHVLRRTFPEMDLYVACCIMHVACHMSHSLCVACCMLYVRCTMHVACCMHVARCMLHFACCHAA